MEQDRTVLESVFTDGNSRKVPLFDKHFSHSINFRLRRYSHFLRLPHPPSNDQTSKFHLICTLHSKLSRDESAQQLHQLHRHSNLRQSSKRHQSEFHSETVGAGVWRKTAKDGIKSYTYQLTTAQKLTLKDVDLTKKSLGGNSWNSSFYPKATSIWAVEALSIFWNLCWA